jgi:Amt family ammonium transporter
MSEKFLLGLFKWVRWVGVPALAAVALLALARPALAQELDPVAEATRGINTVWVLVAAFLVFFMQAGFAFVEAGLTRSKNTVNILFKNVVDFVFATLAFWALGYAFMFGASAGGFIGTTGFLLDPASSEDVFGLPVLAFWLFQLVFAGTAATIVSGAMAERTQFISYLVYSFVISAFIYPIAGHWLWGGGWLSTLGALGFTDGASFRDFAGSTIVHSVGGWIALVGTLFLGPRLGRFAKDGKPKSIPGHSISLAALGVFILWLGWFGFNPGSQLAAAGGNADAIALIAANTNIAAAGGAVAAMLTAWYLTKKPDLGQTLNGILAGLVAITAPCAWVTPAASIVIGAVGGVLVVFGALWLERARIDDPVSAVPVHLMCGIWGTLAVGLFATDTGLFYTGSAGQLIAQFVGVVAFAVWCLATGALMFAGIKATVGLRVSREEELKGLDYHEHGAEAYPGDALSDLARIGGAAD